MIETIAIRVEPCRGNEQGRLLINADDFIEGMVVWEDTPVTLTDRLVEVMRAMDRNDPTLWTSTGKPKTDVLGELVGEDVSGKDRDEAWARANG